MEHLTSYLCLLALPMMILRAQSAATPSPGFTPSCSFASGRCLYTVQLGHTGQCDSSKPAPTKTDAGCCTDLAIKYQALKDDLELMNAKVSALSSSISTNVNLTQIEEELGQARAARSDILYLLHQKEAELNTTKDEMSKIISSAADEIQSLREGLGQLSSSLTSCQTALGVAAKPGELATYGASKDYNMHYYSFNEDPPGFTFTLNQRYQITRLHHGSSSATGPRVEHTWGIAKGSFLGLDSRTLADTQSNPSLKSYLAQTGEFQPSNAYCIRFWYYMEGADVQKLVVNVNINGGSGYSVWEVSGPQNVNKWKLAQVELDSEYTANPFKIDFVMSSSSYRQYQSGHYYARNVQADIAMDDLYVYNTTCDSIQTYPSGAYKNTVNNVTSFYTFHATPKTWIDAYDSCRQFGPWSALVSIQSDEEQAFLVNTIQHDFALKAIGQNGFYTSGTDVDSEHLFTWTNTGKRVDVGVGHWHPGQPNNVANNQDCLLMEYPASNYEWGDVSCNTKHPFICEVEL